MMKKNCNPKRSFPCGRSCVTQQPKADGTKRECRIKGAPKVSMGLRDAKNQIILQGLGEPIGEGLFGTVYAGTYLGEAVVHKVFKTPEESAEYSGGRAKPEDFVGKDIGIDVEVARTRQASDAGFGPKLLAWNPATRTMTLERVQGQPLKSLLKDAQDSATNAPLLKESIASLLKIHQSGFTHGDFHTGNQIVGADGSVRAVDMETFKKGSWKARLRELNRNLNNLDVEYRLDYEVGDSIPFGQLSRAMRDTGITNLDGNLTELEYENLHKNLADSFFIAVG